MKNLKVCNVFLLAIAGLLWVGQLQASIVNLDANTTVSISRLTNSQFQPVDPSLWSISNLFQIGAPLNLHLSYDSNAQISNQFQFPDVVDVATYDSAIKSVSIDSGDFNVVSNSGEIQLTDGNPAAGWTDEIHMGTTEPLQFDYMGESYAVVASGIGMYDQSATLLNNLNLPSDKAIFDSFLTNPNGYSLVFLSIVKMPVDNENWMSNGWYDVYGFLNVENVSIANVSEPSTMFLALCGLFGLVLRRIAKNQA